MYCKAFDTLKELIQDSTPLIACESPLQERYRLLLYVTRLCASIGQKCYIWNLGEDSAKEVICDEMENLVVKEFQGYQPKATKAKKEDYFDILSFWKEYNEKGVLIIENIYPWIKENAAKETEFFLLSEWIKSSLLNIKLYNKNTSKIAILLGPSAEILSDIAAEIPLVVQELPDIQEIIESLQNTNTLPKGFDDVDWLNVGKAGMGLYISDIITGLNSIKNREKIDASEKLIQFLLEYKISLLNRLYDIDFVLPPKVKLGGLELMQESFKKFKRLLTPLAKQYNLRVPKGIMLVGPPGTGKSHSAKVCSQIMGVPLIVVDWGNFRSFGNEAEAKLKRLLRLVDRINQLIIYFDDFDKGFAGDDDLSRRLAGQLLTWMQERTSDVVVIASVNRIEWLPPELTRAGRFDYLYKVDLPNNGERHTIFKLHAARFDKRFQNGGDPFNEEDWRRLLKATNRCVGAEIQTIVERAAATTFCKMFEEDTFSGEELPPLELSIPILLEERNLINPLAIREADRVESMRNKADAQALPSSKTDDSIYALGNVDIFG